MTKSVIKQHLYLNKIPNDYKECPMEEKQKIFLKASLEDGSEMAWGFSLDMCDVLGFYGKLNSLEENALISKMEITGSPFFTPSWYGYLPKEMNANFHIFLSPARTYSPKLVGYLTHIGPVLLAVHNKDYFLAAELLSRRLDTYMAYEEITKYIVKEAAFSALLTWNYGRFESNSLYSRLGEFLIDALGDEFQELLKGCQFDYDKAFVEKLSKEGTLLLFPLVGTDYQEFLTVYENLKELEAEEKSKALFRNKPLAKSCMDLFDNLFANVQAEPYNPHDSYAIGAYIQDPRFVGRKPEATLKAGYMRATLAKLIRKTNPKQLAYKGKLVRIGGTGYNAQSSIIVQIEIPKNCGA